MRRDSISISAAFILGIVVCCCAPAAAAADEKQSKEFAVVGLFSPDREQDLRDVMADVPEFQLLRVDYENARATFSYEVAALFPERKLKNAATPAEIEQRINALLTRASTNTFSLKLTPSIPKEKLTRIELNVGILDCKGCQYAAYLAAMKAPGVERATVLKNGTLIATVETGKTDEAAIEAALKKANIECRPKP
jgi:hypothetical protein